ncbi:MAG: hypothetical protein QOG53_565 [Frankiales bacterium]|jgi:hypothetical protein|nr:hypothetical protein [Frankiales bacterium]
MARSRNFAGITAALSLVGATVVIVLAPPASGATNVATEAALRTAFANTSETKIDIRANINLTSCGTTATTGDVDRNADTNLTLDGHGFTITQKCTGADKDRVLDATGDGSLTVQNVTVKGGNLDSGNGGGIQFIGSGGLTIVNSVITGNKAGGAGGGVTGDGSALRITNSVISNNTSPGPGAAGSSDISITVINSRLIGNTGVGTLGSDGLITVRNSEVSGNTGGGLFSGDGGVTVINSTITNTTNSAAISTDGAVTLVYATIVDNGGGAEPDAQVAGPSLASFGSVIALPKGASPDCSVEINNSNGYNFSDDTTCGFADAAKHDRQDAGNPGLGALANNGGSTKTRKPTSSSPLKNYIPPGSCKNDGASAVSGDQIGTKRPQETGCEIGAFEVRAAAADSPPATPVDAPPQLTG